MLSRVGVLVGAVLLCLLAWPGAASAAPCVLGTICPTPSQTATPPPTRSPTPTATRSATPQPSATRSSTFSPLPKTNRTSSRTQQRATPASTGGPSTDGPLASVAPIKATPVDSAAKGSGRVDKLVALILGAAVLLGVGGVSGLYLTRQRDER